MIRIRKFDEKVSKAEKQEVLNDEHIRAGVEFEIESDVSVIGGAEELSAEDYAEELDNYIDRSLEERDEVLILDPHFNTVAKEHEEDVEKIVQFIGEQGYSLKRDYRLNADVYISVSLDTYKRYYFEDFDPDVLKELTYEYYIELIDESFIRFMYEPLEGNIFNFEQTGGSFTVKEEVVEEIIRNAENEIENYSLEGNDDIVIDLINIVGKDIEVYGRYHGGKGGDYGWRIEPDTSLATETGFELITPQGGLPLKELLPIIEKVFNYIDENESLYTSKQTGFHVNMSIEGVDLAEEMDSLKLALFMEEGKVYEYFESRRNNQYTLSMLKELRKSRPMITSGKKKKEYQKIMQDMNNSIIPKQKYYGINLSKVEAGQNYVEFRYIGGADYHKKYNIIRRQILDYGHFLKLSIDPDYKWKDYMIKLNRLIEDIEQEVLVKRIKTDLAEWSRDFVNADVWIPTEEVAEFFVNQIKQIDDSSIDISEFEMELNDFLSDWSRYVIDRYKSEYLQDDDVPLYFKQFRDILVENNTHRMWDNLKRVWNNRVGFLNGRMEITLGDNILI